MEIQAELKIGQTKRNGKIGHLLHDAHIQWKHLANLETVFTIRLHVHRACMVNGVLAELRAYCTLNQSNVMNLWFVFLSYSFNNKIT